MSAATLHAEALRLLAEMTARVKAGDHRLILAEAEQLQGAIVQWSDEVVWEIEHEMYGCSRVSRDGEYCAACLEGIEEAERMDHEFAEMVAP